MIKKLKRIGQYIGIASVAALLTMGAMKGLSSKLESSIHKFDATGDGIQDIVLFDAKNRDYFAFIGQKDGKFEKAKIIIQDGIPFYQTDKRIYDPWGNSFPRQ